MSAKQQTDTPLPTLPVNHNGGETIPTFSTDEGAGQMLTSVGRKLRKRNNWRDSCA